MTKYQISSPYNGMPREWNERMPVSGTCPHCLKTVLFEPVNSNMPTESLQQDKKHKTLLYMIRRCPSQVCYGAVFIIAQLTPATGFMGKTTTEESIGILEIFPRCLPNFQKEGLTPLLVELFNECIACYEAKFYRAAAIMLRRCVEQVCVERGATGRTLHERLINLKPLVDINSRLYDALFTLKSLGNDAAHVELTSFDKVDKEEVDLGIEVFKKIIDSFYQTEILLNRLDNRQKGSRGQA